MTETQLVARDLRRSFQIGRRRIEVLRGISMDVAYGEAVFLCRQDNAPLHAGGTGTTGIRHGRI
jgi:putative ABC transport system ATP-binding protein/lipoprotein-releasing system ATP-binding protein